MPYCIIVVVVCERGSRSLFSAVGRYLYPRIILFHLVARKCNSAFTYGARLIRALLVGILVGRMSWEVAGGLLSGQTALYCRWGVCMGRSSYGWLNAQTARW